MARFLEGKVTKIRRQGQTVNFFLDLGYGEPMNITVPRKQFPRKARKGDKIGAILAGGIATYLPNGTASFQTDGPEDGYYSIYATRPGLLEKLRRLVGISGKN